MGKRSAVPCSSQTSAAQVIGPGGAADRTSLKRASGGSRGLRNERGRTICPQFVGHEVSARAALMTVLTHVAGCADAEPADRTARVTNTPPPTAVRQSTLGGSGVGVIAFTSERDRNAEICVMNSDGSTPDSLTNSSGCDGWLVAHSMDYRSRGLAPRGQARGLCCGRRWVESAPGYEYPLSLGFRHLVP